MRSLYLPWTLFSLALLLVVCLVYRLIELEGLLQASQSVAAKAMVVSPSRLPKDAANKDSSKNGARLTATTEVTIGDGITPGTRVILDPTTSRDTPQAILARQRGTERRVQLEIGPILSQLQIDPVTRTKLLEYFVERAHTLQDSLQAASLTGIRAQEDIEQLQKNAVAKITPSLESILDSQNLAKVSEFLSVEKQYVDIGKSLQVDAEYRGVPLTYAQQLALARIMAETNYTPLPDAVNRIQNLIGLGDAKPPADRDAFFSAAGSILTPDQMNALKATDAVKVAQEQIVESTMARALEEKKKSMGP